MDAPYALVCAVQDLYSLHQQLSPAGPYRLALFHEPAQRGGYPSAVQAAAGTLDVLVRAAGSLLGSQLSAAVKPLAVELWLGVRRLWRETHPGAEEPPRFRALSAALLTLARQSGPVAVYRLCGEVLGEYLALLAACHPDGPDGWTAKVAALQKALSEAG